MPFDLNKIDTSDKSTSSSKPSTSGGFDLDKIDNNPGGTGTGILPGGQTGIDFGEFKFQPKTNTDNNLLRAQDQKWYSQLAKGVGNAVANTATGIVQGIGYLGTMFGDKTYSNEIVDFFDKPGIHNPFGEIYREHPDKDVDPGDFAWYANWLQSTVEGAASLGLLMYGMGEFSLSGANALADAAKLGTTATKAVRGAAQLSTAAANAYLMGAMSGRQVYQDSYHKQYLNNLAAGLSQEEADKAAKDKAGEAAAATVHMTVALNTLLNLGTVASLFKQASPEMQQFMEGAGRRLEGESRGAWLQRIQDLKASDPEIAKIFTARHGINSMLGESLKGGLEMVNMGVAAKQGERIGSGEEQDDDVSSMVKNYFNHYGEDAATGKGAYDFIFGAAYGPLQGLVVDRVPFKHTAYDVEGNTHIIKDADGKIQYNAKGEPMYTQYRVSSKAFNERGARAYFETTRDAVVNHIKTVDDLNKKLAEAVASKDELTADQIRNQLFAINAKDAVATDGTLTHATDSWKEEYRQITNMDNTKDLGEIMQPQIDKLSGKIEEAKQKGEDTTQLEATLKQLQDTQKERAGKTDAMMAGYARDMNDHEYKQKAIEAAATLDHFQSMYKTIHKHFYDEAKPITKDVVDNLFARQADIHLHQKTIEREQARIDELESLQNLASLGDTSPNSVTQTWLDNAYKAERTADTLKRDREQLLKAADHLDEGTPQAKAKAGEIMKDLASRYAPKGIGEADGIRELASKLEEHIQEHNDNFKTSNDNLENSADYQAWKEANPGKSLRDYKESIMSHSLLQEDKAALEVYKAQVKVNAENLKEQMSEKGRHTLYKQFAEQQAKAVKEYQEKIKAQNTEDFRKRMEDEAYTKLTVEQKQKEVARLQEQIAQYTKERNEAAQKYNEAKTKLEELQKEKGIFARMNGEIRLKTEMVRQKRRMDTLDRRIKLLDTQLEKATEAVGKAEEQHARAQKVTQTAPVERPEPVQETEPSTNRVQAPESGQAPVEDNAQIEPEEAPEEPEVEHPIQEPDYTEGTMTAKFQELKGKLSKAAQDVVDRMESNARKQIEQTTGDSPIKLQLARVKAARETTSISAQRLIGEGVPQDVALDTAQSLRQYLVEQILEDKIDAKPVDVPETTTQLPGDKTKIDPPQSSTGQPEIANPPAFEETKKPEVWEDTAKSMHAGVAVASADVEYHEIRTPEGVRGIRNSQWSDGTTELNDKVSKARMVSGAIKVGDPVHLELDTAYVDKKGKAFKDYTKDGKIDLQTNAHHNIPIKIVHDRSGETLGYLHTQDWLKDGARNIPQYDESGNPNREKQIANNLEIRQRLARMYNLNPEKARLKTTVKDRTSGNVLWLSEVGTDGKVKYKSKKTSEAIPQEGLKYGVIQDGEFQIKNKVPITGMEIVNSKELKEANGSVRVLLPMPDGRFYAAPIRTEKLRTSDIKTLRKAIEAHLEVKGGNLDGAGKRIIDNIKKLTGIDISAPKGLESFMQQYFTYGSSFSKLNTHADAPADASGKKVPKFLMNIPSNGNDIHAGVTYSGEHAYAKLGPDGKLNPEFTALFEKGLAQRQRIVNFPALGDGTNIVRGINEQGNKPFTMVSISEDGKVSHKVYKNYDDYMRNYTSTSVDGTNKVTVDVKEHYVYGANSQVILDKDSLTGEDSLTSEAVEVPTSNIADVGEIKQPEPEFHSEADLDALLLGDDEISNASKLPVKGILKVDGEPITLDTVNQLRMDVPPEEREPDLKPEEVLAQLQNSGLSAIPEGYNPFRKC